MTRATHAGAFRVRFVSVLITVYVVFVLVVTLYPKTVDRSLDPYLDKVLEHLHSHGVPAFVNYNLVEFSANIGFFVPVGFLAGLLVTLRLWWLPTVMGAGLSCFVETCQGLFLPGRVASAQDVFANTSGALIGSILAVIVRLIILHRDSLVIRDVLEGRRAEDGLPVRRTRVDH